VRRAAASNADDPLSTSRATLRSIRSCATSRSAGTFCTSSSTTIGDRCSAVSPSLAAQQVRAPFVALPHLRTRQVQRQRRLEAAEQRGLAGLPRPEQEDALSAVQRLLDGSRDAASNGAANRLNVRGNWSLIQ
jgi:hypothetical protein